VSAPRASAAAALLLVASGCVKFDYNPLPPVENLYFPSGAALAGDVLVVASSNFDLRYASGRLDAFRLADLDAAADGAAASCTGGRVCASGPLPPAAGSVLLSSFSGEVGAAPVAGGWRAFVPVRSSGEVVAVDVAPDGKLACLRRGAEIKSGQEPTKSRACGGVPFPEQDPFQVLVLGPNVYTGHVQVRAGSRGMIGAARADSRVWAGGGGGLAEIDLGNTAVGALAGRCDDAACTSGTVHATGRITNETRTLLYLFDFAAGDLVTSRVYTADLSSQMDGRDARGLALASGGMQAYMTYRAPDAISAIDLTRLPHPLPTGCAIAADTMLPAGGCTQLPVEALVPTPAFQVTDAVPAPVEPRALVALPRTAPGGETSELLVLAARAGIAFFEPRTGSFAGQITNAGETPAAVVAVPRAAGYRLYVPSFLTGRIAVIDLPDPFAPWDARLVALVGGVQEVAK
jgi:hypothetical protein